MTTTNQEFTSLFQEDGFNSLFDPVVGLGVPERKDPPRDESDTLQGLSTGIEGLKASAFGSAGALADLVGAEATAKFAYGQGAAIENFIESEHTRKPGPYTIQEIDDFQDFIDWSQYTIGQALPSLGVIATSAFAGAKAGALFGPVGATAGAIGGGVFSGAIMEAGSIANEQKAMVDNGEILETSPEIALALGTASGAINFIPLFGVFRAMGLGGKFRKGVAAELQKKGLLTRGAGFAALGALAEGSTEAIQEVLALVAKDMVNENFQTFGAEGRARILNAAAAGGLLGTLFGGGTGIVTGRAIESDNDPQTDMFQTPDDADQENQSAVSSLLNSDPLTNPTDPAQRIITAPVSKIGDTFYVQPEETALRDDPNFSMLQRVLSKDIAPFEGLLDEEKYKKPEGISVKEARLERKAIQQELPYTISLPDGVASVFGERGSADIQREQKEFGINPFRFSVTPYRKQTPTMSRDEILLSIAAYRKLLGEELESLKQTQGTIDAVYKKLAEQDQKRMRETLHSQQESEQVITPQDGLTEENIDKLANEYGLTIQEQVEEFKELSSAEPLDIKVEPKYRPESVFDGNRRPRETVQSYQEDWDKMQALYDRVSPIPVYLVDKIPGNAAGIFVREGDMEAKSNYYTTYQNYTPDEGFFTIPTGWIRGPAVIIQKEGLAGDSLRVFAHELAGHFSIETFLEKALSKKQFNSLIDKLFSDNIPVMKYIEGRWGFPALREVIRGGPKSQTYPYRRRYVEEALSMAAEVLIATNLKPFQQTIDWELVGNNAIPVPHTEIEQKRIDKEFLKIDEDLKTELKKLIKEGGEFKADFVQKLTLLSWQFLDRTLTKAQKDFQERSPNTPEEQDKALQKGKMRTPFRAISISNWLPGMRIDREFKTRYLYRKPLDLWVKDYLQSVNVRSLGGIVDITMLPEKPQHAALTALLRSSTYTYQFPMYYNDFETLLSEIATTLSFSDMGDLQLSPETKALRLREGHLTSVFLRQNRKLYTRASTFAEIPAHYTIGIQRGDDKNPNLYFVKRIEKSQGPDYIQMSPEFHFQSYLETPFLYEKLAETISNLLQEDNIRLSFEGVKSDTISQKDLLGPLLDEKGKISEIEIQKPEYAFSKERAPKNLMDLFAERVAPDTEIPQALRTTGGAVKTWMAFALLTPSQITKVFSQIPSLKEYFTENENYAHLKNKNLLNPKAVLSAWFRKSGFRKALNSTIHDIDALQYRYRLHYPVWDDKVRAEFRSKVADVVRYYKLGDYTLKIPDKFGVSERRGTEILEEIYSSFQDMLEQWADGNRFLIAFQGLRATKPGTKITRDAAFQIVDDWKNLAGPEREAYLAELESLEQPEGDTTLSATKKMYQQLQKFETEYEAIDKDYYFPHKRFGRYTVLVVSKKEFESKGETIQKETTLAWESFRTQKGAKERAKEFAKMFPNRNDLKIVLRKLTDTDRSYLDMSSALHEHLADTLNLTKEQRIELNKVYIKQAPAHALLKHMQNRKWIPGQSQEIEHTYSAYMVSMANQISKLNYMPLMRQSLSELKREDGEVQNYDGTEIVDKVLVNKVYQYAEDHFNYLMEPGSEWAMVRSMMFTFMLGFTPKAAMLNFFQLPQVIYPVMAGKYGDKEALKHLGSAITQIGHFLRPNGAIPKKFSKLHVAVIDRLMDDGIIDEGVGSQFIAFQNQDYLGDIQAQDLEQRYWAKIASAAAFLFRHSERATRLITTVAAVNAELEKGNNTLDGIYKEVSEVVKTSNFVYSRHDRAAFQRGRKGTLFIFMAWLQQAAWIAGGGEGRSTSMRFWLMMMMMGGMLGVPFGEDMADIVEFAWNKIKKTGEPLSIQKAAREFLTDMNGIIEDNPQVLLHGFSSHYGLGPLHFAEALGIPVPHVDISGSAGMGRVIPALSDLAAPSSSLDGHIGRALVGATGPAGSTLYNFVKGVSSNDMQMWKRAEYVQPFKVIRDISQATRWGLEGGVTTKQGGHIIDFDMTDPEQVAELATKALGFMPSRLSESYRKLRFVAEVERIMMARRNFLMATAHEVFTDTDNPRARKKMRQTIREFNSNLPKELKAFVINSDQLMQSIRGREQEIGRQTRDIPRHVTHDLNQLFPSAQ